MAKLHQRIFAASGAILFFVTSAALTIAVIYQAYQDKHSSTSASTTTQATGQNTCADNNTETSLPKPEIYKPTGPVSSLQTTDLTVGSGATAKKGDCLIVKYYGTLASNGNEFDENYDKSTAFAFKVGDGEVIPGWDQGLIGMKEGGVRRLVIPAALAYGSQSPSEQIPANSDLVFVVSLLRIK